MTSKALAHSEFDQYASDYDRMLAGGLAISGEDKDYFARGRIDWLKSCLKHLNAAPEFILDFGCGTGGSVSLLHERFGAKSVLGVDPSASLIERAERRYGTANRLFKQVDEYSPCEEIDLVYCNGVFHHIQIANRRKAAEYVWRALKPGGYWAFWENNPWNPATRYVMSRIPFDRDAVTLSAPEASGLLQSSGFHILKTDYFFVFPKSLRLLRWMEPLLASLPVGAQYLVLARKAGKLRKPA
jgi:trans-aconitate methyltransferase